MTIWESDDPDEMTCLVFDEDCELEKTRSINGSFEFLQMVGVSKSELDAIKRWDAQSFTQLMKTRDALLIFDPKRRSWLSDPSFAASVEAGIAEEGIPTSGQSCSSNPSCSGARISSPLCCSLARLVRPCLFLFATLLPACGVGRVLRGSEVGSSTDVRGPECLTLRSLVRWHWSPNRPPQ